MMQNPADRAIALAKSAQARSIAQLGDLVRIRSLTGEEGPAQAHIESLLRALDAKVTVAEPDVAAMFRRFPNVAQYPTHWQHDLILPYAELPTYQALQSSGLESVLNYTGRPNVVGRFRGTGGGVGGVIGGATWQAVSIDARIRAATRTYRTNGCTMEWIYLEAAIALALLIAIVWWTAAARHKPDRNGPPPARDNK